MSHGAAAHYTQVTTPWGIEEALMNMGCCISDRSTWAIGGGVLLGLGVGLIVLPFSALAFVGSLVAGIGIGLIITAILSNCRQGNNG